MSKRVFLKLDGYLEHGFKVTLEVGEEGNIHFTETTGYLPANLKLIESLDLWNKNYCQMQNTRIILEKVEIGISKREQINTCLSLSQNVQALFKKWLESVKFQSIEKCLREALHQEEAIRVLVCTPDKRLRKLPWHKWEFIDKFSQSEIAFTTAPGKLNVSKPRKNVRVLAILGSSEGIDTEADRKTLNELPSSDVKFLVKPSRKQINDLLWDQSWDIFFFAGHSDSSENQGRIYINSQDSLTLDELKYSLRHAIKNGLQLAIFNSCDGLGLADELEQLHLPQFIVMRSPLPDKVAHEFLKGFLNAFARGDSLYIAARKARERLQGIEDKYPCATWLPIIFQNPVVIPPTWEKLANPLPRKKFARWRFFIALGAVSVVVTGLLIGVRFSGMLQGIELSAYDQMMRMRPQEFPDSKFVIIQVTEDDLKLPEQKDRTGSLSDQALDIVLNKLKPYQPRVIALNLFREQVQPKYKDLVNKLQQDNVIGMCFVGNYKSNKSILPPPELQPNQIGYADVVQDPDNVMRRAVFHMKPNITDNCQVEYSLSWKIAETYLKKENINLDITQGNLKLGKAVFKPLENHSNGYQKLDDAGHQMLINYRSVRESNLYITPYIYTLEQVLKDNNKLLHAAEDNIVIIGVNATSVKPDFSTPYSQQNKLPVAILHAQIASQIINAALGERPLLGVWSIQTEVIWIWAWSFCGGLLFWQLRRAPVYLVLAASLSLLVLYVFCYGVLAYGSTWIPFIPAVIVFVVTGCVLNYRKFNT